jgi:hypothetical protein
VPARIKLPGGRPKKFAWRAIEPGKKTADQSNGQGGNHKNSGNESKVPAEDQQTPGPKARA